MDGFQNKKSSKSSKFDLKSILVILFFAILSVIIIRSCLVRLFPEDDGGFINAQKIVLSDEEEIREDGKTALEIAGYFCLKEGYNVDQPLFLNADDDEDSEVAGVCWEGDNYDREGLLFVLDKQEGEYAVMTKKEDSVEHQRQKNFENIDVVDIDEDGLEEIVYGERGWSISGSDLYLYLYSPKYDEWFYRVDKKDLKIVDEETVTNEKTEYSENLAEGEYPAIKSFLVSHFVAGDGSGIFATGEEDGSEVQVEEYNLCANDKEEDLSTKYYEYKLVFYEPYSIENYEQKLVRKNRDTGEETIIVKSIKESLPELKEQFNLILVDFAQPNDSDKVFFRSVYSETDNGSGYIYVFDVNGCSFTKSKLNEVFDNFQGYYETSPNNEKALWIPDDNPFSEQEMCSWKMQSLQLVSLSEEKTENVLNLSGNETFGPMCYLGCSFDVHWVDDTKIKYAVLDQSKWNEKSDCSSESAANEAFMEYRQYNLQN
ncbi:MAG: hypothetical protein PHI66_01115 [Candidatus Pacebacteria bacterium]|nr:hypothetical protein [Candidatus Paceibacterota bacterium]